MKFMSFQIKYRYGDILWKKTFTSFKPFAFTAITLSLFLRRQRHVTTRVIKEDPR